MQISNQEAINAQRGVEQPARRKAEPPVHSVEELAAKHGVDMDEVRRMTEAVMMGEGDPLRERRVREIARRVAEGTYNIEAENVVDMAERRAMADRAADG
jgi:anti-sigma28 factor (negative regulator of flagellin synthesis)